MLESKRNPLLLVSIGIVTYYALSSCAYLIRMTCRDLFVILDLNPLITISFTELIFVLTYIVGILLVFGLVESKKHSDRTVLKRLVIIVVVAQVLQFIESLSVEFFIENNYLENMSKLYVAQKENSTLMMISNSTYFLTFIFISLILYKKIKKHSG